MTSETATLSVFDEPSESSNPQESKGTLELSSLPRLDIIKDETERRDINRKAQSAADFLKAISHEGRLMILCSLAHGERSVTELEAMLSTRQSAVSQQLARLRQDGIVSARRDGKQIYYKLTDQRAQQIVEQVYELFCK